jgi:hypothetical protein
MARVAVTPIGVADLDRVGVFLHANLNERISAREWERFARVPWNVEAPNNGFMLVDEGVIVGVYLAFYSSRMVEGRIERFCNLAAWCVLPRYRLYSLQLLRALLTQPGYHFTDLSPSANAVPVNERMEFTRLDTATALMPNLPRPSWPGRSRVISDRTEIEGLLTGRALEIYRDHRFAGAANHLVLTHKGQHCYVIYRRDRRKNLPLFASVLYVSDPEIFYRTAQILGRHLLVHQQLPFTLMELRVVGRKPAGSMLLRSSRPKMFKSSSLEPSQIDNLYSELVCVAW